RRQKTLPHQKHERDKGEPSNECYRHADHHPLGIEPRRSGGERGEALDRLGHGSGSYATGSICSLCSWQTGRVRAFALSVWPRTPTPNSALIMILMMVMIMRMAVSVIMRMMLMMVYALRRAAAAGIFAEQKRFDRHRHRE